MGKFRCVCGHVISTSGPIPNPDEWHFIRDEAIPDAADRFTWDDLRSKFGLAYLCPESGHLWVFHDDEQTAPSGYAPIAPQPD